MAITIGQAPGHDFDEPLAMLSDCHRRIERFLGVLVSISGTAQETLTAEQQAALSAALWYFRESGRRHTADEEESLFPRLRAAGVAGEVHNLEDDHRQAELLHGHVDQWATRWMSEGKLTAEERSRLQDDVEALAAIYKEHIALEDQVLFPMAGRTLSAAALGEIGREMAVRRGLTADRGQGRS